MNVKVLIYSFIGGVIITLLTGLAPVRMLVGATHYGYPFSWLTRLVIAPEHFPWRVNALTLIVDIIVWSLVIGIVQLVLARTRK